MENPVIGSHMEGTGDSSGYLESSVCQETSIDSNGDIPDCNDLLDQEMSDPLEPEWGLQESESFPNAVSPDPVSDYGSDQDDDSSLDRGVSEARFKDPSFSRRKEASYWVSTGSRRGSVRVPCNGGDAGKSQWSPSESNVEAFGSGESWRASIVANYRVSGTADSRRLNLHDSDDWGASPVEMDSDQPDSIGSTKRNYCTAFHRDEVSQSQFKNVSSAGSSLVTTSTNEQINDLDMYYSASGLAKLNNYPDLISESSLMTLEPELPPHSPDFSDLPSRRVATAHRSCVEVSESRFKTPRLVDASIPTANDQIHDHDMYDSAPTLAEANDFPDVMSASYSMAMESEQTSYSPDSSELPKRHRFAARRSSVEVSESRFKTPCDALFTDATTDDCNMDDTAPGLPELDSDLIEVSFEGGVDHLDPLPGVRESCPPLDLLVETSASYRKRTLLNVDTDDPALSRDRRMALKGGMSGLAERTVSINPETVEDLDPGKAFCCKIPFNGHEEDIRHFQSCEIQAVGICFREEHSRWLARIPQVPNCVDLVIGQSCKRLLLNGKCTKSECQFKHPVDINFDFPPNKLKVYVAAFTKWFVDNAQKPDLRAICLTLSQLPEDRSALMFVFSLSKMIPKLKKIRKKALGFKLLEILVNAVKLKPWAAIQLLLTFYVTKETTQKEIRGLLYSLEVKSNNQRLQDHLYESVSCLWHVSEVFACPADVLLQLLKECFVQMPTDLKLTKDRMVADLVKLPRRILLREFPLIDKFFGRFYPQNSETAYAVRCRVLYQQDPCSPRAVSYESSRVKGTGPVNNKWKYWDVQEAQVKGFERVVQAKRRKAAGIRVADPCDLVFEELQDDATCEDLYKFLSGKNRLEEVAEDAELVESLRAGKYDEVVQILNSRSESRMDLCLALQQELEHCEESKLSAVAFDILLRLQETEEDTSALGHFVSTLNSIVLRFYNEGDFSSAIKLIKTMRVANVNHMEHVLDIEQETFSVICSEIHFECRLYSEAIRYLMYNDCLNFEKYDKDSVHFMLLENVVVSMFKTFLKHRLPSHALEIFRVILLEQKSLHAPIDIGRFYEGTLFMSFIPELKNACVAGDGARMYVTVDRLCGNYEKFHSITYRSLLVELTRVDSPEDVVRRTLCHCLKSGAYPDFTVGRLDPVVLNSQLTTDEMTVYLRHYFAYSVANEWRLDERPFVVRLFESRPVHKPFPVANEIMKTPWTLPDAIQRLKSAVQRVAGSSYEDLNPVFSEDSLTIQANGVQTLLEDFKP